MSKRVTVSQFYKDVPPACLIQHASLRTAVLNDDLFFAIDHDSIEQHSIGQKTLIAKVQLPQEKRGAQVGAVVELNQTVCFYFVGSSNLYTSSKGTLQQIQAHIAPITCIHQHGNKLYSASQDLTIRLWLERGGTIVPYTPHHALFGHSSPVSCLTSVDTLLLSGSLDRTVIVWQGSSPRTRRSFQSPIKGMLWCQESDQLAVLQQSGIVSILSLKILRQTSRLVVSRLIQGITKQRILNSCEIDDSFMLIWSECGLQVIQINLGTVIADIDLSHLGKVLAVKSIKALTLVGVEGKGLFLLKF